MIRTGSPVSCKTKKTTVTTPKMTKTDCHNRRITYCVMPVVGSQPFQSISWAQIISSLRGSHFTQLSTP
jgi:hypothetical protein